MNIDKAMMGLFGFEDQMPAGRGITHHENSANSSNIFLCIFMPLCFNLFLPGSSLTQSWGLKNR